MKTFSKTYSFGKVDYYSNNRKMQLAEVYLELNERNSKDVYFSVTFGIWNNLHTDYVCCGCGVENLLSYDNIKNNETLLWLIDLHKKYHLKQIENIPFEDREVIFEIIGKRYNYWE